MERFSGLKKGGRGSGRAGAATDQRSATPGKGKFKLRTAKDPLPLLMKKPSSRETKPKAKFLQLAGAGASTDKPNTKPSTFATNSFIRPLTTDAPSKKSAGFSFMKFQPKASDLGKVTSEPLGKAAPLAFANTKPLFGKFSVNGLAKKTNSTGEVGARTAKEQPFKPQASLPFAFRADTKASIAKKRKAAASSSEAKNVFLSKSGRTEGSGGFAFMTRNKEKGTEIAAETSAGRSSHSLVKKESSAATKANEGAVLKKRGLVLSSAEEGLAPKRSKHMTQTVVVHQRDGSLVNSTSSSRSDTSGIINGGDTLSESPVVPQDFKPIQASSLGIDAMQSNAMPPPSPDCREECLSGIEDELAVKLLCTLDDDKEDFLTRTAAIQDFTDRVGLEQKQLRNRLLDAHADVSESLLDALTDLMAEEGGIRMDKLAFDMNIDVDVGDAFLQEEIQVLQ